MSSELWQRSMEREEDRLEAEYERGTITLAEFNAEMRELSRAYQHAAEEAAEDEYESWFA